MPLSIRIILAFLFVFFSFCIFLETNSIIFAIVLGSSILSLILAYSSHISFKLNEVTKTLNNQTVILEELKREVEIYRNMK